MKKTLLLLFTLLFAVMSAWAQTNTWYVATTGDNTTGDGSSVNPWLTITHTISQAASGDVIIVAAGTYIETGQVLIDKNITITGAGKTATIIKPDGNHTGYTNGWFKINTGVSFNLSDVKLDGTGYDINNALFFQGSGVIEDCAFTEIKYQPSGPAYRGTVIRVYNNVEVKVLNCVFTEIGRDAIRHSGTGLVQGNTYTGKGDGNWLDYFILAEYGCDITIDDNEVTSCTGVATVDGSGSGAITAWDDSGTKAIITNNLLTGNSTGIAFAAINSTTLPWSWPDITIGAGNVISGGDYGITFYAYSGYVHAPIVTITGSTITATQNAFDVGEGVYVTNISLDQNSLTSTSGFGANNEGTGTLDAECNWWGSTDASVIAAKISGPVDWSPFWTTSTGPCDGEAPFTNSTTGLSYATLQAALDAATDGQTVTVNVAGTYGGITFNTGQSVALTNSSGGIVTFVGASPALTVTSGTLTVSGMSYTTATNDPTILINGGTLNISDCSIEASTGFDNAAIRISSGTLNAGTSLAHGGNTFIYDSSGDKAIDNQTATACDAIGNYWGSIIYPEFIIRLSGPVNFDPWCNSSFSVCTYSLLTPGPVTYAPKWIRPAGTVVVPITVTNFNNVMAVSLKLGYTTSQLTYGSIAPGPGVPTSGWLFTDIGGVIAISYQATSGFSLADNAVLLNVTFTYAGTAQGYLTWIETDPSGTDLEYTDAETQAPYYDIPNANYYIPGYITNGTLSFTREYPGIPDLNTEERVYAVITPDNGPYTYSWTGPNSYSSASNPAVLVQGDYGVYTVVVTDGDGATISGTYYYGPVHNINTYIDYATIQLGIDADETLNTHTLTVDPGTYAENVDVDKELIITKSYTTKPVIQASAGIAVEITVDNVTIDGFEIKHSTITSLNDMGIRLNQADNCTIQNNLFTVNSVGIMVLDAGDNYIYLNEFAYNAVGIYLEGTTDGLGNFDGGPNGPFYSLSLNNVIELNNIHHSILVAGQGGQGIYLDAACEDNEFITNTISYNAAIGYYAWKASNNTITGNTIQNNGSEGIQLQGSSGNSITGNTVSNNPVGFWMRSPAEDVTDNIITGNTISENVIGIKMEDDYSTNNWPGVLTGNTIKNNKIFDNTSFGLQVVDVAPGTIIVAEENWWGDPTGPYHATNPCGLGNAVSDNVDFDPWYFQEGMTTLNGLPALTLSAIPDISTITATPIVVSVTVNYPDLTGYDPAVLTDAVISTTEASFPAGTKVIEVIYTEDANPPVYIPVSYVLSTGSAHFLSDILGNPSPYGTPLVAHSSKTIDWKLIIEGATSPIADFPVSIQSISYLDRGVCLNALGDPEEFNVTFAPVAFVYNDAEECYPNNVEILWTESYPLVENVDPSQVWNDSKWYFYSDEDLTVPATLPAGTTIQAFINNVPLGISVLANPISFMYGSAVAAGEDDPTTNENGLIAPLERDASVEPTPWKVVISGAPAGTIYVKVENMALLGAGYPYDEYVYDEQDFKVNYVGAAGVAIAEIDNISTITGTPVVLDVEIAYGDLASQNIDPSVKVDALIEFDPVLPAGAYIVELAYNGNPLTLATDDIGAKASVLLSSLLDPVYGAPTPLFAHDGLTDVWTITATGVDVAGTYTITFKSIAYVDIVDCYSLMAETAFDVIFANATMVLSTPAEPVCYPVGVAEFEFDLNHPVMDNVSPDVTSNAIISSDKIIPAGTVINWVQTIDRDPDPDDVYSGSYEVLVATDILYMSEIWGFGLISPFPIQESDPIHWAFEIENLEPGTYNFDIQAAAQLPDGSLYPYATLTPPLQIIVAGALGVTMPAIDDISTITATPVIFDVTVNYGADGALDAQAIHPSVKVDALIEFVPVLPAGAHIVELAYNGNPLTLATDDIGAKASVLLSSLLDPVYGAPTPLFAHDGLTDVWTITAAGVDVAGTYTITFKSIAYVDIVDCYSLMAQTDFDITFADAAMSATTTITDVCYPAPLAFNAVITYPTIQNLNTAVLTDAYITSDYTFPIGTIIKWGYNTPPAVTYTLMAAASSLYLSDITGMSAPLQGHSGTDTWYFELSNAGSPIDIDLTIQPVARLNGNDYHYTDGDILNDLLVKNCNISGTLQYNNAAKTPMNGVTLTLSPSGISAVTDNNGVFTLDIVPNGTYAIAITHAKAAGSINATDAAQVNYWGTTSQYPIEYVKFLAGDVYGNGTDPNYAINATDASHIQLRFVTGPGYDGFDRLPWVYWKANDPVTADINKGNVINVTVDNANVSQNLLGQVTGDFNSSYLWNPTKDMAANVHLTYSGSKQAGANTAAELSLRMVGAAELSAVSLVFHYPEELMTVLEVSMKDNPGRLDWAVVGKELRIGWNAAAAVSFADGEELLIIRLQTSGSFFQGNTIQLALTADPINELADGNLNIIPGAGLSIDMLESSTLGTGDLPIVNALSLTSRPNPFGSYTHLIYALPADGHVMLFVNDMTGRSLALLVDELAPAGTYQVKLDGLPLEPGVYTATILLKTSNGDLTRTVKLIRTW